MYLGRNNRKASYFIESQQIVTTELKDLGFLITRDLELNSNCNDVAAKA